MCLLLILTIYFQAFPSKTLMWYWVRGEDGWAGYIKSAHLVVKIVILDKGFNSSI